MRSREKIIPFDALPAVRDASAPWDEVIVAKLGSYDIAHPGHIESLEVARDLGTVLVAGVWPDEAVREWKGPDRPYQNADARMRVLAAVGCVDYVFEVPLLGSPELYSRASGAVAVLDQLEPDYFVLGGEASVEPGGFLTSGGRLVDVRHDPTYVNKAHSTTEIGARINGHRNDIFPTGILPPHVTVPRPAYPGSAQLGYTG